MIPKFAAIGALLALGAFFVLHHPPSRPPVETRSLSLAATPSVSAPSRTGFDRAKRRTHDEAMVVYVTGAVKRPGLYQLRAGDRYAKALELAGGLGTSADSAGVNLAQRASDGDEIDVPAAGERARASTTRRATPNHHRGRRRAATPPPDASVDVNAAGEVELAAVPGIGRAVAGRIVELRQREGNFTSLDELLDVAGMTSSRLERARPYLRDP
ncbi:MAG TPA: ComEA family DNA-binding protein [Candidatus Baltobacteraceae bacterium]|jgi:competence protein ComEA|nr:ComEA family DNA-binding protein [Candidatus Baltobacteraceae bacterium]